MGVQVALVVFLMFAGTVEAAEGSVTFSGDRVTLTCPDEGMFYNSANQLINATFDYKSKGMYSCNYIDKSTSKETTYKFYVKGKTCKNCFELDAVVFAVAIGADLIFTSVIMITIYKCTKKKNPAAPNHAAPRAPARPGARPPPVPSVDYEPLNPNTRSHETYSMVNRTG